MGGGRSRFAVGKVKAAADREREAQERAASDVTHLLSSKVTEIEDLNTNVVNYEQVSSTCAQLTVLLLLDISPPHTSQNTCIHFRKSLPEVFILSLLPSILFWSGVIPAQSTSAQVAMAAKKADAAKLAEDAANQRIKDLQVLRLFDPREKALSRVRKQSR